MDITKEQAIKLLNEGEAVSLPTETVYGLAARYDNAQAVEKIFTLKGRPRENPLIIHIASLEQLRKFVNEIPPLVQALAAKFWPGPLTLVLPIIPLAVPETIRSSLPTAAFRMPNHASTLDVLAKTGPVVMPSANLSGSPSSTCPGHVEDDFGKEFPILNGGVCRSGVESTILLVDDRVKILRQGMHAPQDFEEMLGFIPEIVGPAEKPICPGQMFRHYAPKARLLFSKTFPPGSTVIGFTNYAYPDCRVYSLSSLTSPEEAAKNLYAILRQLDADGVGLALIDNRFPKTPLFDTVRERLKKASGNL